MSDSGKISNWLDSSWIKNLFKNITGPSQNHNKSSASSDGTSQILNAEVNAQRKTFENIILSMRGDENQYDPSYIPPQATPNLAEQLTNRLRGLVPGEKSDTVSVGVLVFDLDQQSKRFGGPGAGDTIYLEAYKLVRKKLDQVLKNPPDKNTDYIAYLKWVNKKSNEIGNLSELLRMEYQHKKDNFTSLAGGESVYEALLQNLQSQGASFSKKYEHVPYYQSSKEKAQGGFNELAEVYAKEFADYVSKVKAGNLTYEEEVKIQGRLIDLKTRLDFFGKMIPFAAKSDSYQLAHLEDPVRLKQRGSVMRTLDVIARAKQLYKDSAVFTPNGAPTIFNGGAITLYPSVLDPSPKTPYDKKESLVVETEKGINSGDYDPALLDIVKSIVGYPPLSPTLEIDRRKYAEPLKSFLSRIMKGLDRHSIDGLKQSYLQSLKQAYLQSLKGNHT